MVRIPTLKKDKLLVPPGMKIGGQQSQFPTNRQEPLRKADSVICPDSSEEMTTSPTMVRSPAGKKARLSPSLRPADEIKIEYFEN